MAPRGGSLAGQRSLRRARSSGAIFAETVIVVPVLILLFAGSIYLWHIYAEKMDMTSDVRQYLWTDAQASNCNNPGDTSDGYTPPTPPSGVLHTAGDGELGSSDATQQSQAATGFLAQAAQDLGNANAQSTIAVMESPFLGGKGVTVGANQWLKCNEPPYNANPVSMAKALWNDITSW